MPGLISSRLPALTLALAAFAQAFPMPIPYLDKQGLRMEVQAHRGGRGLRSEETAWAFAYAMVGLTLATMHMLRLIQSRKLGLMF